MDIKSYVKDKLFSFQDLEYKKFHSSLCPGINNIIGVRVPLIRDLAKELIKNYSFGELYNNIDTEYYEEIMVKGLLIGFSKENLEFKKEYIVKFIPLIDNWAVCDSFCSSLKFTKSNKKEMREFILKYIDSDKEYEVRFLLVMILNYYIEEEYLLDNFKIFDYIKNNSYYVEMALAWAISICLIKYYDQTFCYLKESNLSDFVYNKSISKACDSYRISNDKKIELKKLRR